MAESHNLGRKGEDMAAEYLKKAGYKILFRNWKWGKHEIDIIAGNKEFIIFVEVKTRTGNSQVDPLTAINKEKQKSIIWAAEGYLKINYVDKESRFDVIIVIKRDESYDIDHIESAFYPTLR